MQGEMNCPRCGEEYKESSTVPLLLVNCGHTFCKPCIKNLSQCDEQTTKIICPQDSILTTLSKESQLPKNIALLKLISSKNTFKQSTFSALNKSLEDQDAQELLLAIKSSQENCIQNNTQSIQEEMNKIIEIDSHKKQTIDVNNIFFISKEQQKIQSINSEFQTNNQNIDDQILNIQNNQKISNICNDTKISSICNDTKISNKCNDTKISNKCNQTKISNISNETKISNISNETKISNICNQTTTGNTYSETLLEQVADQADEMCLLHNKPLDVVCMQDKQKICSKCAIYGKHKGHDFKPVEDIDQKNSQFYAHIRDIIQAKNLLINRMKDENTLKQLIDMMKSQCNKIKKEVNEQFKILNAYVTKCQKKCLNKLDDIIRSLQCKIINTLTIDAKIISQYNLWEQKSLQKIKGEDIACKLELYFKGEEFISKGNELTCNMNTNELNILNQIEHYISGVNYKCKSSFLEENFVQVYEQIVEPTEMKEAHLLSAEQIETNTSSRSIFAENKTTAFEITPVHTDWGEESLLDIDSPTKTDKSLGAERSICAEQPKMKKTIPLKRKLKSIKVPQKYQKMLQSISNDTIDNVDFTNAELGDATVLQILELFKLSNRVKSIKLIRNKLTDQFVSKVLPLLPQSIMTINLSQNGLTEKVLWSFIQAKDKFPMLKNIVLSQNKIIERKHKAIIDKLRKMDITVSV